MSVKYVTIYTVLMCYNVSRDSVSMHPLALRALLIL